MLMRTATQRRLCGNFLPGGIIPRRSAGVFDLRDARVSYARNAEIHGEGKPAEYIYKVVTVAAPFGLPFLILVALTLMSMVVGPFAAAAMLRHGLD